MHTDPAEMFRVTGLANYTLAEDQGYLLVLNAMAHLVKARVAVEIGSRRGASAIWIAKALADQPPYIPSDRATDPVLYCVDPFIDKFGGDPEYHLEFKNNISVLGLAYYVKQVKKLSTDALTDIPDVIDFLFLDGDLSEAGLTFDLRAYASRVRIGGALCVHDLRSEPAVMPTLVAHPKLLAQFSSFLLNDRLGMYVGIRAK